MIAGHTLRGLGCAFPFPPLLVHKLKCSCDSRRGRLGPHSGRLVLVEPPSGVPSLHSVLQRRKESSRPLQGPVTFAFAKTGQTAFLCGFQATLREERSSRNTYSVRFPGCCPVTSLHEFVVGYHIFPTLEGDPWEENKTITPHSSHGKE